MCVCAKIGCGVGYIETVLLGNERGGNEVGEVTTGGLDLNREMNGGAYCNDVKSAGLCPQPPPGAKNSLSLNTSFFRLEFGSFAEAF